MSESGDGHFEIVLIWSGEHGAYWRPKGCGYTASVAQAGLYMRSKAEEILSSVDEDKALRILPVPSESLNACAGAPADLRPSAPEVGAVLGLEPDSCPSMLALCVHIDEGLLAGFDVRLRESLDMSAGDFDALVRRPGTNEDDRLRYGADAHAGECAARLARGWLMAMKVFGDAGRARAFLRASHPMLNGRTALGVIATNEPGLAAVEQVLGRLQVGSVA